jgi:hypothetical protein
MYLSVAQETTEDYKLNSNKRFPKADSLHSKHPVNPIFDRHNVLEVASSALFID